MDKAWVMLNDKHSQEAFGMHLVSYSIGRPLPMVRYIEVPGRPGKLDATLALNGKVNYLSRSISMQFHVRDHPYEDWHQLLSELWELFEGTETKVIFGMDPDWYYRGRFSMDSAKSNAVTSEITLSCDEVFPYKLDAGKQTGNWDFDPAVFDGTHRMPDRAISSSREVTCRGFAYNGTVTIYASAPLSVSFLGSTFQLTAGANVLREIHFKEGDNVLTFTGSGMIRIAYERGIL